GGGPRQGPPGRAGAGARAALPAVRGDAPPDRRRALVVRGAREAVRAAAPLRVPAGDRGDAARRSAAVVSARALRRGRPGAHALRVGAGAQAASISDTRTGSSCLSRSTSRISRR